MELICKICDREFKTTNGLSKHLQQTHKISVKYYYEKYINKTSKICNNINCHSSNCTWLGLNGGYRDYCSTACSNSCNDKKDKTIQVLQEKYNVSNIFQLNETKNKIKTTNIEKYGCENISSVGEIKNKKRKTFLKNGKPNNKHDKNSSYHIKSNKWRNSFATFNTYKDQLIQAEDIKLDENGYLLVKCTYCGKFHITTNGLANSRVSSLNGRVTGENRFYCSDGCKRSCPIFNQKLYPKGLKIISSREVQPELRKLVFERDNQTCQKCKSNENLHCHHFDGILFNPIESADIDNCITLCKNCHKEVHKQKGCTYNDMKCI